MSEAGGSTNDSESQQPIITQLSQLLENEGALEKLAELLGTARLDQELEDSLSLSNTLSGSLQEVKDDLEFLYKEELFRSDFISSKSLTGGKVTLPKCPEVEKFFEGFCPGQEAYRLSANIHLKALRRIYRPFFGQILELVYFDEQELSILKKYKDKAREFERHRQEEERCLFMLRIIQTYFYCRFKGSTLEDLDMVMCHAILFAGNTTSYVADARRDIIGEVCYKGLKVTNGSIAKKNEAWSSEEKEALKRNFEIMQMANLSKLRNLVIDQSVGKGRGQSPTFRGPFHNGRGRGRNRGRGRGSHTQRTPNNDNQLSEGGADGRLPPREN